MKRCFGQDLHLRFCCISRSGLLLGKGRRSGRFARYDFSKSIAFYEARNSASKTYRLKPGVIATDPSSLGLNCID